MNTFKIFILLFVFICSFSSVKLDAIEGRGLMHEPVIFQVQVNARCEVYKANALSSIQISRFTNPGCLPISSKDPTQDVNDRHSHVFCTNIGGGRSVFRFHEIFSIEEDETPAPGEIFIISWAPNFPFVELTGKYTYLRRPSCAVKKDLCSTKQIVDYCNENRIFPSDNGFVETSDRVYFIPPGVTVNTCYSNSTCCPYISTEVTGICGGKVPGEFCANNICNDNDLCTNDTCVNGKCVFTPKCNDNSVCTNDTCDPLTGNCTFTDIKCNDGINCTFDRCNSSTGCFFPIKTCHDNNPCTADRCDESNNGNCVRTTFCDDGALCTDDSCINPCAGQDSCPLDEIDHSRNMTFFNTYCVFTDKCRPGGTCNKNFNCCSNVTGCGTGRRVHNEDYVKTIEF